MFRSPRTAYEGGARSSSSSRDLEAQALLKAARQLESCRNDWASALADGRLLKALDYNQRLWTFLQAELAAPENPLPADVRSNLLSLSLFVDRRTFDLRLNPVPDGLEPLVRLNRELALGLSERPAPATPGF